MKKIFILSLLVCLLCGCTSIQEMSLEDIVNNGTGSKIEVYNNYRKGYKYNVPKGLAVVDNSLYNEVLASNKYSYYLYVDAVSYYNKVIEKYNVDNNAYVSMPISYEDQYGYLEINVLSNKKYFIEIMYNYAKIEVIVKEEDIKLAVANAISVLSSVSFSDKILSNLLDEETAQFKEYGFNIFETKKTESSILESINSSEYEEDDGVYDIDLID